MLDEDYGDITDPQDGRDVKVVCTKAPGRMWATTEVRPRGKQSDLCEDAKQAQQWLKDIPELDEIYTLKSYEELEKIVNDWLSGDDSQGDDLGTPRGETSTSTPTGNDDSTSKYKSLDDAFADLEDL